MALNREQIRAARKDRKPVRCEVPEWGGEVFIRVLSARDQMDLADGKPAKDMPILVLLHCLVDEGGERILTDEDFDVLAAEEFPLIMRLFTEVARLNGLSTTELEEAMEGFDRAPDASSSTG